ncbi:quinone oxidoreductase family protein [Microbacterium trichothecenolyticum]|uniref:Zinc-type alcohol dehydrogenase-like protein n=1 Tax=Microbacterium trichothecenolyticum TaxID=69370 RepID=A0A0M2HCC8_MICTR|nr:NADP-dependent oxidoreductase [Microbacterium trichothecenolyticum]KJL42343.1 Zinc-type alcohol dehydrogenase-like protein [Microbacterium trichothecenolyticum]
MLEVKANGFGGPEVLTVHEVPERAPGAGEVAIRVAGCGVNPTDTMRRKGAPGWHVSEPSEPFGLGMDLAGVVEAVGEGVSAFRPGDPVMAMVVPSVEHGAYAERVVVSAHQVARAPKGVDLIQAATVPMNGLTALLALEAVNLPAGATLAVTGAAGTLGSYAIQIAKARGLRIIADSSPADEERLREMGADHIVPRGPDVATEIRRIAPSGVAGLLDASVQGAGVLPAVADGGTVVVVRPGAQPDERVRTVFVIVSHALDRVGWLEELSAMVDDGTLTPHVAHTFGLAEAPEAHRIVEAGGLRGRIVLVP